MPADKPSLADLRREIDRIDDGLHDLLMERIALTADVAASKGDAPSKSQYEKAGAVIRPAREAEILRRLVARHHGRFPRAIVARIWREIIGANTALQAPFAIAVLGSRENDALVELARAHYGQLTPILAFETASSVLRAVGEGTASVGLLPLPSVETDEPWWRLIARDGEMTPRVVARLPFAPAEPPPVEALAVALAPNEATGEDRSLLVIETDGELSRSTLRERLATEGLRVVEMQGWSGQGQHLTLAEVEGFVAPGAAEIASLDGENQILQIIVIGAYALPLTPAELAGAGEDGLTPKGSSEAKKPARAEP